MKFVVPPSGGIFDFASRLKAGLRTSSNDRGDQRVRRAGLTGFATLLARGVTVSLGLITLPLTSHYLGKERFGLWLTLSALIAWFAVADLGLANSLVNALAGADGRNDRRAARSAVAGAFWIVVLISILAVAACVLIAPIVAWPRIFNVASPLAVAEITPAVMVVSIFCALRLPAAIAGSIWQGYQEGYVHQIWTGLGGLLSAAGLFVAIRMQAGLPWLAGAFLGGLLLADLFSAIHLFGRRRSWMLPMPRYFDWARAKQLLRLGGQFWIAQMSAIVLLQTDLIVVSWLFGASETAPYGATLRLFALIGAVQAAFVAPLWAAYGEAIAKGDREWLSRAFKHSLWLSLFWSVSATAVMFAAMPLLFRWLLTDDVVSDPHLRLAVMIAEIVNSITRCIAMLLNGLGAVRTQMIYGPICGAANIALSVWMGRRLGPPGVAWATAICLAFFWIGLMGRAARRELDATR